jgi:hypothetical protein
MNLPFVLEPEIVRAELALGALRFGEAWNKHATCYLKDIKDNRQMILCSSVSSSICSNESAFSISTSKVIFFPLWCI